MTLLTFLVIISTLSFLFFGISCFFIEQMRKEFIRYGLSEYVKLTGAFQILGALGLGFGYLYMPYLSVVSAASLSLLMLFGFGVRLRIKDSFIQSAPSIIYAIMNTYIAIAILLSL